MGPEGGAGGGNAVVAEGTPEDVATTPESYRQVPRRDPARAAGPARQVRGAQTQISAYLQRPATAEILRMSNVPGGMNAVAEFAACSPPPR